MKRPVIVDTNVLMQPFKRGTDISEKLREAIPIPIELFILRGSVEEIHKLSKAGPKYRRMADVALKVATKMKIIEDRRLSHLPVDKRIIRYANRLKAIVATNDVSLREELAMEKIPTVFYRTSKNRFETVRNLYW